MSLTVEFRGGFKDGTVLVDSPEATAFYDMSNEGALGYRMKGMSDAATDEIGELLKTAIPLGNGKLQLSRAPTMDTNHVYEVVESTNDGVDQRVVFEYKGQLN